jgi:hypothetical protein
MKGRYGFNHGMNLAISVGILRDYWRDKRINPYSPDAYAKMI